jgi:hypothetical protein
MPRLDSGQLPITLYCDIGISLDRGCQSIVFIKVNLVDAGHQEHARTKE